MRDRIRITFAASNANRTCIAKDISQCVDMNNKTRRDNVLFGRKNTEESRAMPSAEKQEHRPLLTVDKTGGVGTRRHVLIPVDDTSVRVLI